LWIMTRDGARSPRCPAVDHIAWLSPRVATCVVHVQTVYWHFLHSAVHTAAVLLTAYQCQAKTHVLKRRKMSVAACNCRLLVRHVATNEHDLQSNALFVLSMHHQCDHQCKNS
jgi:hypothetical protein